MKLWYTSKILWTNILGVAGLVLQLKYGYIVSPEMYMVVLMGINAVLRIITKEDIVWSSKSL